MMMVGSTNDDGGDDDGDDDNGFDVYNKRHIMLVFKEAITGTYLEALIQLIDNNLSDEPIVKRISQEEANVEGKRIIDAYKSSNNSSSQSSNDLNRTKKCPPVVKTYGTRSKSSVIASSVPKTPAKTILVYQPSSKLDGVTITSEDMLCLEPSTYLNDVIIDFFFKYIIEEKLTPEDRDRLHLFSTFFYDRLTQKNTNSDEPRTPTSMHRMVKSWTKNVDIFSKDFLIIPINE
ncbi:sentrin-specific protease 6-like, partial [Paramuricea clavata]